MEVLKAIVKFIDGFNDRIGRGVSWFTSLLVAVVFVDVMMRYLFNISFVFTQELEWHIFAFIFLMGAGYTLLYDGHVRVDIIYQRLSTKSRAWVNFICCFVFLFPGCFLVIYTSLDFVANSYEIMEGSPDPGGIPFRFIIKSCIPAGFILFALQGVSLMIRSFLTITGHADEDAGEVVH